MDFVELDRKLQSRRRLPSPAVARAIREDAGLAQDDLARALGVTRAAVSRWESGERYPRTENLARYLELLDHLRGQMAA